MIEEDARRWESHFANGVIFLLIISICGLLFMTAFSFADNYNSNYNSKEKIIEIKVKDVIKTEDTYIIFDTDNSMYAYSKLLPEISTGKNYTVKYDYTISTFYKFYKVSGIAEV